MSATSFSTYPGCHLGACTAHLCLQRIVELADHVVAEGQSTKLGHCGRADPLLSVLAKKGVEPQAVVLQDGSFLEATVGNPVMGGDIWRGEEDAADILRMAVEKADSTGRLREILDAVKSNRVEDDFSDRWSF